MALSMDAILCQLAPIMFRMELKIDGGILSGRHW
jgi:hypothetical protein